MIRKKKNINNMYLLALFICKIRCAASFQPVQTKYRNESILKRKGRTIQPKLRHQISPLSPTLNLSGDDRTDDDYIDEDDLGDWRSFRKNLLETGLSSPSSTNNSEGYIGDDQVTSSRSEEDDFIGDKPTSSSKKALPKSVSKANEELLMSQSGKLGQEYLDGAWAHSLEMVEEGGLVVRLPLEVEIYKSKKESDIGKELSRRINQEDEEQGNDSYLTGVGADDSNMQPSLSFSLAAAKTLIWYKKAQKLIEEQLRGVISVTNEKGEIDPSKLNPSTAEFLQMYLDNQESWQEVCLVLENNHISGLASTLIINRPMAFKLSSNLALLVLYGSRNAILMQERGRLGAETEKLSTFLSAFERECAVYVGGPDNLEDPGKMIHGFADLDGAKEISAGTGIYEGGISAAIDGVLKGKYKPLDFRFFVGSHEYIDGELDLAVNSNKYQPIACARSVALKQCIQLPKPLWHEILELCGDDLKDISSLELMKRRDIQIEEEE